MGTPGATLGSLGAFGGEGEWVGRAGRRHSGAAGAGHRLARVRPT